MVVSFDFRYMLILLGYVKYSHGLKLVVGWDNGNTKTMCGICANDGFSMFDDVAVIHIVQFTSWAELEMF